MNTTPSRCPDCDGPFHDCEITLPISGITRVRDCGAVFFHKPSKRFLSEKSSLWKTQPSPPDTF